MKLISKNVYSEKLKDDKYFYFNVLFDDNAKPIIGNGSDEKHLNIIVSVLICLMLTSHETESDFLHLYNGLLKQAEIMDLDWEPDFSMQDACRASLNAIAKVQPSTVVLMCYFHVMDNIRKKKKLVKSDLLFSS